MTDEMSEMTEKARRVTYLDTPNGLLGADKITHVQLGAMKETIEPYVLDESPDVISIGRRCRKYGYGFYWNPFSREPYFV